jgi:hypothetical protein
MREFCLSYWPQRWWPVGSVECIALHEHCLTHIMSSLSQLGDDLSAKVDLLREASATFPHAQVPEVVVLRGVPRRG